MGRVEGRKTVQAAWVLRASTAAMALAVAGCGGSGGSRPNPTPTPPPVVVAPAPAPAPTPPPPAPVPPPTSSFDTAEYRRSNGAVAANALPAYQAGASGAGVKIAVIDSGINAALPDFAGRIDPASTDTAGNRGVNDEDGHGTAVAAIAAAGRNDNQILGVAFNATILAYRSDLPGSCARTGENESCEHTDSDIAEAVDLARAGGARVINISLGGSPPTNQLIQSVNRATASGIIVVVAGGNDGDDPTKAANADSFGLGLARSDPSGLVILAGSVGVDIDGSNATRNDTDVTQLSLTSNRAGIGAPFFLSALGFRVIAPNVAAGNELFLFSGTSFSAPVISGAVALVAQAFPNLTGRQIVDLLFRTANDLGDAGDDAVHGQGSLNIGRAFQPVGAMSLAGSGAPVSALSNGAMPLAAGDAKTSARAIVLDEYARAFDLDLGETLHRPRAAEPLRGAIDGSVQSGGVSAGPIAVSLTTARNRNRQLGVGMAQLGLTYRDDRAARLIAGMAVARVSDRTAIAMGFSEGAKALEKRLAGVSDAPFLIARDPLAALGFDLRRGSAVAVRRQVGRVGITMSGEQGRIDDLSRIAAPASGFSTTGLTADTSAGPVRLTMSAFRMREDGTVLGGRFASSIGASGATSWFVDGAAEAEIGSGWQATARYRRGWTGLTGADRLTTDAFAFDLARDGMLRPGDRFGVRIAQPLRIRGGGIGVLLPTSYSYATLETGYTMTRFNLAPEGRELDLEATYSLPFAGGWLGANAFARRQPGHIAAAADYLGGAVQFSLGF